MTSRALALFVLVSASLQAATVVAAPKSKSRAPAKSVYQGAPTPQRGKLADSVTTLPSLEERKSAASEVVGGLVGGVVAQPVAWAAVSVRKPYALHRAALVFAAPEVADARLGIASWSGGTAVNAFDLSSLCVLFGCPGDETTPPAKALQLWVEASAGKKYLAVCRVRLEGKKGDVTIESDDNFTLTQAVDHTGKSSGRVSWLIDPASAGWYGFSVSTPIAWSTSGCTVDEI
jgi:hypothetical protein